ncbi:XdhC family protein [Phytohabitans aurantiacus]|uniref:Xanthine dehydrogenase accessory factor n=1 Tax=Phytohabitans aurantiacus TaxID=3016789 RepID=A0ABQ5R4K9_9ACTN|nr:XdhC family protein [Phytohabitans aurantiacus]GLI01719.1 xanthine dehydrogenase accessory factor [Phytohabitans aurantiacus]
MTTDPACATAHGDLPPEPGRRTLVAVFESPVADYLLKFAADVGYRTVLVDPAQGGTVKAAGLDSDTDVVVTDHDRPELGEVLRDALAETTRWIGLMGSPRHAPPHIEALRALGVTDGEIGRVHRPIGLNIGSKAPAEIAIATLAGLIADRNGRPGGFDF